MTKLYRIFLILILTALLVVGVAGAQEVEPGQGGIIVWGNQRGSSNIDPITPLRCSGVDCADLWALIYPAFIGLNSETLSFERWTPDSRFSALATDWSVSEDGLTYTFKLRDDLLWSDGTPVSATDVYFMWAAMQNMDPAEVSSSLAPAKQEIVNAEVVDATTIVLTFAQPTCLAINRAALLNPVPAHIYGYTLGQMDFDWNSIVGHPMDTEPSVSAGPFQFSRTEAGTAIYLNNNPNYSDPTNGMGVFPQGLVYLDVPDYVVMAERLITGQDGDVNYIHEPTDTSILPTLRDSGQAQVFSAPGTLWHYVALNLADPDNAQNGLDENGNVIDQGHHPIFGDKRVRQALQAAVNIDEIVNGPLAGNATPMVAGTIPTAFTIHPTLERRPYNMDTARATLDEAGWKSTGDPLVSGGDGLRICDGCMYAETGTPLEFEILNVGDIRNDVSVLLQAQFAQIGVKVNITVLDFNTMYDDNLGVQVFDSAVAGWRGTIPFNADLRSFFGIENDIVSADSPGFNFGSWYNAEFEELSAFIASNPGCDDTAIKEAAYKVQEIMYDEQPYLWLYAINSSYIASNSIQNFAPFPSQGVWNIDSWAVNLRQ